MYLNLALFSFFQVCDINSWRRVPDRHPSWCGCVQKTARLSQGDFSVKLLKDGGWRGCVCMLLHANKLNFQRTVAH